MKEAFEKIIERLEARKRDYHIQYVTDYIGYSTYHNYKHELNEVIEIVNQAAEEFGNDFCEWFKYDYRTIAPKNHDVGNPYWRIPEDYSKLMFCPYCGKKIKVVK